MPFTGFLFTLVLFYVIVRVVTKDEGLTIWNCFFWVVGTRLAGLLVGLALGSHGLNLMSGDAAEVMGMLAAIGVLTFILHSQGYAPRQTATIIGILVAVQLLPFVLLAIADSV